MASTVRKTLCSWFGRGQYPTAEQFSDLFDSFFHRTEDRIPLSTVESLTDELNGKYSAAEGQELAQRTTMIAEGLRSHQVAAGKEFNNVQDQINALGQALTDGDAATLQAANSHTDSEVATEQSNRESGDQNTLASAKAYADAAVAAVVNGSPAALDTLRELADALGGDPNFATTVAGQIGSKVDKVAGKGLSTEDYTTAEKTKLAGIATGANNYTHPATHSASIVRQDATHRFVTDAEKTAWNGLLSEPKFVVTSDEAYALDQYDGKIYIVIPAE